MSMLVKLQLEVCRALRELPFLQGVPVIAAETGNVAAEWDERSAKTHLSVTVGAADFTPTSRDSGVITGMARLEVAVHENPTRNRVGQGVGRMGPTATETAEQIAGALHLMSVGDGVLVLSGIGGIVRDEDKTIVRTVSFETLATLGAG